MRHRECRHYAPIDVTKGLCHRTKDPVKGDLEACLEFRLMPRCGNCREFVPSGQPELGSCTASPADPKFFAYPDMVAVTCDRYRAG